MASNISKVEIERFNDLVFDEEYNGYRFRVYEEKHHDCCTRILLSKGRKYIRHTRYPKDYLAFILMDWKKGVDTLEKYGMS